MKYSVIVITQSVYHLAWNHSFSRYNLTHIIARSQFKAPLHEPCPLTNVYNCAIFVEASSNLKMNEIVLVR